MRWRPYLFPGMCLVSLAGCAAYRPYSIWNDGGYSEHPQQPDRFQVRFVGNDHSTEDKTEELAVLRAAELCLDRKKPFMRLQDFTTDYVRLQRFRYAPQTGVTVTCMDQKVE